jgi:ABC-type multidrug transport system fused ATPase/permease subunit
MAFIALLLRPEAAFPVRDSQVSIANLTSLIQEAFQGARIVKAFGMEQYEKQPVHKGIHAVVRIFHAVGHGAQHFVA